MCSRFVFLELQSNQSVPSSRPLVLRSETSLSFCPADRFPPPSAPSPPPPPLVSTSTDDLQPPAVKEHKPLRRTNCRSGEESDSDFESDPPSPEEQRGRGAGGGEEEALTSEHGDDTEPENLGQRPLLMDSEEEGEEEEDDKHSSDSDYHPSRVKGRSKKSARSAPAATRGSREGDSVLTLIGPLESPSGSRAAPAEEPVDVFGFGPFAGGAPRLRSPGTSPCPARAAARLQPGQSPPGSPEAFDIFGFSPFHPGSTAPPPVTSRSADDIFQPSHQEPASPQQQRLKQRSLQKLSSRQRRTKQEATAGGSKRHHGTPTGGRKTNKPTYRTPERVRRHKKVGRRDSQSSNEFLSTSDSKENISVDITMSEGKDKGASLPPDEAMDAILDPFGAKPFHPQDGCRHSQYHGLVASKSDTGPANGRTRAGSLHAALGDGGDMDDFGAVPFTEVVVPSGPQQQPHQQGAPSQPGELDPFGAAPFPSKQ
ncbi:unnamed protein product [Pleuronectes platessa]|uniref:BMP-2-inducible protein kinase C-terminal domain-containing protein n=1 Tax=Pleuronectes platessa TaxID=8262 RepID=A0A9N7W081_PLEPL|nr:unnamed protein product [Pleuronectes platessa]